VTADPEVGSLVLEQIRAPGLAIGEAFLVVGPDGTSVLIDVADDPHADAVREALVRHTGEEAVDHVVLTHLHLDHIGGFDTLFPAVPIRQSVVLRGGVVGDGASAGETANLETTLTTLDVDVRRLCAADPCLDLPHVIDLGDGAALTIALANGSVAGPDGVVAADVAIDPDESDGENAMSLGGFVTWGDFAYVFAGDLGGGGKGTPDVEGFVAQHAGPPGRRTPRRSTSTTTGSRRARTTRGSPGSLAVASTTGSSGRTAATSTPPTKTSSTGSSQRSAAARCGRPTRAR
jgi:hypothetical protein